MKNGDTRRGPLSRRMIEVSAIVASPPIPEPMMTPVRSRSSSSSGVHPASFSACSAAATAKRMKVSTLRWSFGAIQSSALKVPSLPSPSGTSQAMSVARCDASKRVIFPAPDCPATSRAQVSSTPHASGVTMPSPVITTRRVGIASPSPKVLPLTAKDGSRQDRWPTARHRSHLPHSRGTAALNARSTCEGSGGLPPMRTRRELSIRRAVACQSQRSPCRGQYAPGSRWFEGGAVPPAPPSLYFRRHARTTACPSLPMVPARWPCYRSRAAGAPRPACRGIGVGTDPFRGLSQCSVSCDR